MTEISKRLSVEGPDRDGEYELTLSDCDGRGSLESHWISQAEADALIAAIRRPENPSVIAEIPKVESPPSPNGASRTDLDLGTANGSAPDPSSSLPALTVLQEALAEISTPEGARASFSRFMPHSSVIPHSHAFEWVRKLLSTALAVSRVLPQPPEQPPK
jgi:hypothetical protein